MPRSPPAMKKPKATKATKVAVAKVAAPSDPAAIAAAVVAVLQTVEADLVASFGKKGVEESSRSQANLDEDDLHTSSVLDHDITETTSTKTTQTPVPSKTTTKKTCTKKTSAPKAVTTQPRKRKAVDADDSDDNTNSATAKKRQVTAISVVPVSEGSRTTDVQAAPVLNTPYVLKEALAAIEAKVHETSAFATVTLRHTKVSLEAKLADAERDPANLRPIRALRQKLDAVSACLERLEKGEVEQDYLARCEPYVERWRTCELKERARKAQEARAAKTAPTRHLPAPPHGGSLEALTTQREQNYGILISQEAKQSLGLVKRPVGLVQFDTCPSCKTAMRYNTAMQQLVCLACKHWKRFADMTSAALLYGEDFEFCRYTYKAVTHLNDTMRTAEGSEPYVVPPEHLERIMLVLRARRVKPEELTIAMVRKIIDNLAGMKVEHAVQCYCRLSGHAPRRMTQYMQEQMRLMFNAHVGPFRKHCMDRINNLNFHYTLYKFCELLGYWEMLESFPLLRGETNLARHDAIFSKVCKDLDWQYIPTIGSDKDE
jgi:hypothetical protein